MSVSVKSAVLVGIMFAELVAAQTAWAQRYLTEFVGRTHVVTGPDTNITVDSGLEFVELANRRVEGFFSLLPHIEQDNLAVPQVLAAQGTLSASGNCNVQMAANAASGSLKLVEQEFDANSFALVGKVTINQSGNAGILRAGKSTGNLAVLRPVADAVPVVADGWTVALRSSRTGATSIITKELDKFDDNMTAFGRMGRVGDPNPFAITVSANSRWIYLVGTNAKGFIKLLASVETDSAGSVAGYVGSWELLDSTGKVTDEGTVVGQSR